MHPLRTLALIAVLGAASSLLVAAQPAAATRTAATPTATTPVAATSAARPAAQAPAGAAVEPTVRTVPVSGVDPTAARSLPADLSGRVVALSRAVAVTGYGAVGATWAPDGAAADQRFSVRTRTDGRWSRWQQLPAEAEHAPTPGSAEASGAVPGTDPMVVGEVDRAQLAVTAPAGRAPQNLSLAVIDPGEAPATGSTARLGRPAYPATAGRGGATRRPAIYSRAQWGAKESMRNGFAGFGEVHGAFVHHTVNANRYSRADVPSILRGIYAYHTQGQNWSDVGYNFLVDRFGRVWEGRWGGIDRPVIGAHTLNYNEDAFAMSAIGNFETGKASRRMLRSYGRLFAWKLSLHGVEADARANIDGLVGPAINGHRDAASTACPGRRLYARLRTIRQRAGRVQDSWAGRQLRRSVAGGRRPDLLVSQGRDTTLLAGGGAGLHRAGRVRANWSKYAWTRIVGDWDRDGHDDVLAREGGRIWLLAGRRGDGRFDRPVGGWRGWGDETDITPVGDWDGDGRPDLVARTRDGSAWVHPGRRRNGFAAGYRARSNIGAPTAMFGVGRWDRDGAPDLMTRSRSGKLRLWPGNGPGGLEDPVRIASGMRRYDRLIGVGDLNRDGHPDLVGRRGDTHRLYLLPGRANRLAAPVPVGPRNVLGKLG